MCAPMALRQASNLLSPVDAATAAIQLALVSGKADTLAEALRTRRDNASTQIVEMAEGKLTRLRADEQVGDALKHDPSPCSVLL